MLQLSWRKASAAVRLAGLTPREAARGALTQLEFQLMLDPLDLDPFGKVIVKGEVSAVLTNYFIQSISCQSWRTHISTVYNNLILQVEDVKREDTKSWFEISKLVGGGSLSSIVWRRRRHGWRRTKMCKGFSRRARRLKERFWQVLWCTVVYVECVGCRKK